MPAAGTYVPSDKLRLFREDMQLGMSREVPSLRIPRMSEMKRLSRQLQRECLEPRSSWDSVSRSEGQPLPGVPTSPRMLKRVAHSTPTLLPHARVAGLTRPALRLKVAAEEQAAAMQAAAAAAAAPEVGVSSRPEHSACRSGSAPACSAHARLAAGRPVGVRAGFQGLIHAAHLNGGHLSSVSIRSKHAPMPGDVAIQAEDGAAAGHAACGARGDGRADGVGDEATWPTRGVHLSSWRSDSSRLSTAGQPLSLSTPSPPRPDAQQAATSAPWSGTGGYSGSSSGCVSVALAAGGGQVLQRHYADHGPGAGTDCPTRLPKPTWNRTSQSVSMLQMRRALEMAREKLAIPGGATHENVAVEEMLALAYEQLTGSPVAHHGELFVPEEMKVRILGPELVAGGGGHGGGPSRQSQHWRRADAGTADAESERGGTPQPKQGLLSGTAGSADLEALAAPSIPSRRGGPLSTVGPAGGGWEASLRTAEGASPGESRCAGVETTVSQPAEVRLTRTAGRGAGRQPDGAGTARLAGRVGRTPASIPAVSSARAFAGECEADSLCSGLALSVRLSAAVASNPRTPVPVRAPVLQSTRAGRGIRVASPRAVVLLSECAAAPVQTVRRLELKSRNASKGSPSRRARSPARRTS